MIQPLSLDSARALIDFSGGGMSTDIASEQQLQGSLALHNLLTQRPFVYLADEVGMVHGAIISSVRPAPNAVSPALSHHSAACQAGEILAGDRRPEARLSVCDPGCQPGVTMA